MCCRKYYGRVECKAGIKLKQLFKIAQSKDWAIDIVFLETRQ
jgi:hypothetical protein